MAKLNVLSYNNLVLYDELLKNYIDKADAKAFKTVAIDGFKMKFYTVEEPVGETEPAFEIELPKTDLSGVLAKLTGAVEGDVVVANADGTVKDSGVKLADLATKETVDAITNAETGILAQAKTYTDEEVKELADGQVNTNKEAIAKLNGDATTEGSVAKAVKDAVDGINESIGELTEGKTIVEMITDATYDDSTIKANIGDLTKLETEAKTSLVDAVNEVKGSVDAHKEAIDETVTTLVGEDTGKSVRTIANEELAAQLLSGDADADFQTLQELATWLENHPESVAEINLNITNLQKLVGTLPEDATSTDVVSYIAEAVAAEKTRAEKAETDLAGRIDSLEGSNHTHENKTVLDGITSEKVLAWDGYDARITANNTAIVANANAITTLENGQVATNKSDIASLKELVGDGVEEIDEADIRALFGESTEA